MSETSPEKSSTANNESSETPTAPAPPRRLRGWKWVVAYGSILSTTFLFALDNTIVAAIQPAILESLGRLELLPWISVSFAVGSTPILPWGKCFGIFSVKKLFLLHILIFEIGSAICGAAPNMTAMVIGRVIAGLGGSGMYSGALTYIAMLTTEMERSRYVAGVSAVWGLGSVLGPVIGGGFSESSATWRWAFYINLVIGGVFSPAYLLLLPDICLQPGKTLAQKLRMIDWTGVVIFLGGAVCFTMAIAFSGLVYPWSSGSAIALWVMTGALLLATIAVTIWHPFVPKVNRLIPAEFFRNTELLNLQVQMYLVSGIFLAAVYYIPLFFAFAKGDGSLQAGVRLLPFVCFLVAGAVANGIVMPKTGYYMPWYTGGSTLMLIGCALMVTVSASTSVANIYGYTLLVGAGSGAYLAAGISVTQALVPVEDVPNAVGLQAIAQVLGSVTFLSVSGNLLFNFAVRYLTPVLPPGTQPAFILDLIAGPHSHAFRTLEPDVRLRVVDGIARTMRNIWTFYLAASALSFILSLLLRKASDEMLC
ncbi:MFS general substrate transporter [Colletotrichum zoysiae]|uniref:MFS general substrate transporter n=1 Tax=Colletotrichum zoysiae TaxID=1216348 RepID=A0AAD9LWF1_9PEZI|nr:MFS general substrate transporter [Colletotrichum zoysiae]